MRVVSITILCAHCIINVILAHVQYARSSKLVDTAVSIANAEFYSNRITVVIYKSGDSVDVTEFLVQYNGTVVIVTVQNDSDGIIRNIFLNYRPRQILVLASNSNYFEKIAEVLNMVQVTPFRAILLLTEPIKNKTQVTEAMRAAWKNDIGDIVVLTVNVINKDVDLWTYYPYGNGECGNHTAVLLGKGNQYYPRKFMNFYGCPIRIALLECVPYVVVTKDKGIVTSLSGIDGKVLNLISEKLNASKFELLTHTGDFGTIENGTATGSLRFIVNRTADILAPSLTLSNERYNVAQISNVFHYLYSYWCGPTRKPLGFLDRVIRYYSHPSFLVCLSFSFIVFIPSTYIIRRYALCKPERKRGIFLMCYQIFLGLEVKRLKTKCWLLNYLFALWIWFCMLARIIYQVELIYYAQITIYEPPLGPFAEAVKKVEGYGGEEFAAALYNDNPVGNYKKMEVDEIPMYIKEIAEGKKFLILINLLLVQWYHEDLQVLIESTPPPAPLALHMRPGWPASSEVRAITVRLMEAGLIREIDKKYDYEDSKNVNGSSETKTINFKSMEGLFYVVTPCYVIALFTCAYEIIRFKYDLNHIKFL